MTTINSTPPATTPVKPSGAKTAEAKTNSESTSVAPNSSIAAPERKTSTKTLPLKTVKRPPPKTVAKVVQALDLPPAKEARPKKPKLVRDSFTIPKDEYVVIETLKLRSAGLARPVKKSELLRAGLKVLAALSDSALHAALQGVPSIKTGRPKSEPSDEKSASKATKK